MPPGEGAKSTGTCEARAVAVAEAGDEMVVHHARRLHVGVDDRRADEVEASRSQVQAQPLGLPRARRQLADRGPAVLDRSPVDEAPYVCVERAEILLHGEEGARVLDRGRDFHPVPDDAWVGEEAAGVAGPEASHPLGVEARIGAAVALAPREDGEPREPGLRSLEDQELEHRPVVVDRHAPLLVVVGNVERPLRPGPRAASLLAGHRHATARRRRWRQKYASRNGPNAQDQKLIATSPAIAAFILAYMPFSRL